MNTTPKNTVEFAVWGRYALFTDPLTRLGGEKCSYPLPTYEALKGIAKSIYWKPSFIWVIDAVRIIRPIRTQSKNIKTLNYKIPGHDLSIYTYLTGDIDPQTGVPRVEYQVRAHFEWNLHRSEFVVDWNGRKHNEIASRFLERGGNKDIFLGTRECQGYVEPCVVGSGIGAYDEVPEIRFGMMFHSFGYPDETGSSVLQTSFWRPTMVYGVVSFPRPENIPAAHRRMVRPMAAKRFVPPASLSTQPDRPSAGANE